MRTKLLDGFSRSPDEFAQNTRRKKAKNIARPTTGCPSAGVRNRFIFFNCNRCVPWLCKTNKLTSNASSSVLKKKKKNSSLTNSTIPVFNFNFDSRCLYEIQSRYVYWNRFFAPTNLQVYRTMDFFSKDSVQKHQMLGRRVSVLLMPFKTIGAKRIPRENLIKYYLMMVFS